MKQSSLPVINISASHYPYLSDLCIEFSLRPVTDKIDAKEWDVFWSDSVGPVIIRLALLSMSKVLRPSR